MSADSRPYLGSLQPGSGPELSVTFAPVSESRDSKKNRPPTVIRNVLAQNVKNLRDRVYADLGSETARNRVLARDSHMTLSQAQRIIAMELGTSIDYVEYLAHALKVRPQDLLTPYFTLHLAPPAEDRHDDNDEDRGTLHGRPG